MFGIGSQELRVILLVVFLIFGPRRLPELGAAWAGPFVGLRMA